MSEQPWQLVKRPTGMPGLDNVTEGGLPDGQTTLLLGGSGSGKSVLCLQILARAVARGTGGVFVTFEESPAQVRRNADSFRWGPLLNDSGQWDVVDARIPPGAEIAGEFDIDGLLGAIEAACARMEAPWVVIDGIDQLLQRQPSPMVAVDQVRQLNEWCEQTGNTMILTGKVSDSGLAPVHLEGAEFMLPTCIVLSTSLLESRLTRSLRVAKYRGSGHCPDDTPLIMNDDGIQLPYHEYENLSPAPVAHERVSIGVPRLDQLLAGGLYRGSSTLISGRPGTAKSTLAGGFADAAATRGDKTLYVSFDEIQGPYVRNLMSVGIDLQRHIDAGRIRFCALRAGAALVTEHYLVLRRLIDEFRPDCLVIDPISALLKATGVEGSQVTMEHILAVTRERNITTVMTSLTDKDDAEGETTSAHVSTIADTWIVLDYNVRGGERNRSLSIVKSRGSAHSNQQRELLLSDNGVDLEDVYEYGSEVLMGTARAQKESEQQALEMRRDLERLRRQQDLERRIEQAHTEQQRLETELALEQQASISTDSMERTHIERMKRRREPPVDDAGVAPEDAGDPA